MIFEIQISNFANLSHLLSTQIEIDSELIEFTVVASTQTEFDFELIELTFIASSQTEIVKKTLLRLLKRNKVFLVELNIIKITIQNYPIFLVNIFLLIKIILFK